MLCGIMLRVYQLTSGSLAQAADQQASRTVQGASARGTIDDRNLVPLVNTEKEYRAAAVSYTHLDVYKRQVWAMLFIRCRIPGQ